MDPPTRTRTVPDMFPSSADPAAQPIIQTTGRTKRYGATLALDAST